MEAHTQAKHEILKRYLQGWFPIQGSWCDYLLYIDGFAGPGIYKNGEIGSPIIAINSVLEHRVQIFSKIYFYFIELDKERAKSLDIVIKEKFPVLPKNIKYQIDHSSYQESMDSILHTFEDMRSKLKHQKPLPIFAFLDPFGYSGMPIQLTKRLFQFPACEVLITFMESFINRFTEVTDKRCEEFDSLFGCANWREVNNIHNPEERKRFLLDLYIHQLKSICEAKYVRCFEMVNRNNQPIYFLVFATKSFKGLKVMKDAMWKKDPTGHFQFSDCSNPDQKCLFDFTDEEPWKKDAGLLIFRKFLGKTVPVESIEEYVYSETPYIFRKECLKILEKEGYILSVSGRKRPLAYPEGSVIQFKSI